MVVAELALLPGLNGTRDLFTPLLDVIPRAVRTRVVEYPPERELSYRELLPLVSEQLRGDGPLVVLGESFSGPLALWFAATQPTRVRAVVLSASFVRNPTFGCVRWLAAPWLLQLPVQRPAIQLALLNGVRNRDLLRTVLDVVPKVQPSVFIHRVREICALDSRDALQNCAAPILYLRAANDRIVGARSMHEIVSLRRDVVVRAISAPHLLLQAEPAAAWRELESFLTQHDIALHSTPRA